MPETIFTMGYGRTSREAFQERLLCLHEEVDKRILVIDIRKEGSRSRNGKWCHSVELSRTVYELGTGYGCWTHTLLVNQHGNTKAGLEEYRSHLRASLVMNDLLDNIYNNTHNCYVLLCAERKPFKTNDKTPNCHRVILAEELVKELGEDWEVKHLE